jgi:hypothetical protein
MGSEAIANNNRTFICDSNGQSEIIHKRQCIASLVISDKPTSVSGR